MLVLRRLALVIWMGLFSVQALANTRFAFGTIVGVNEKKQVVIQLECGNSVGGRSWERKPYSPLGSTRHGLKFWMLDDKNVSWEEAARPGRAVTVVNEQAFVVSSTVPGWEPVEPERDVDNALCLIRIPWGFGAEFEILDKQGEVTGTKGASGTMQLLVDVCGGKPGPVMAVWQGSDRPHEEVKVEELSLKDGTLTGTVEVTVYPNQGARRLPDGKTSVKAAYSFSVTADEQSTVRGEWWRGSGKKNPVSGILLTRPGALPERKRLWMRIGSLPPSCNGHGFVVSDLGEGETAPTNTRVLFSKGYPVGEVTGCTLRLDGSALTGEVQGNFKGWSTMTGKMVFEGTLFGNRYIFGSYQVIDDAGKMLKADVFHAGFGHQDGPDLAGHTAAHNALIKLYGKKPEK